ncbi:hypothetical protein BC629DRAFT_1435289 [Irpex lacteus]|nr:hypothetical protein BC629DRAFT_1435289 [Irpex lacteus]
MATSTVILKTSYTQSSTMHSLKEVVENDLMSLLPIKEEHLVKIPSLLPDLTAKFKPVTMSFGWVVGIDEIERLGQMKGEYMTTTPVHYYELGDPDCPEDAEFEDGICEVFGEEVFSPMWTASRLLRRAKKELGLDDKYEYTGRCPYFIVNGITAKFDGAKDTMFQAEAPLPTRDDIKRMQEWLGLKEEHREPGWWFSMVGLAKTTWRQYWIEGDM